MRAPSPRAKQTATRLAYQSEFRKACYGAEVASFFQRQGHRVRDGHRQAICSQCTPGLAGPLCLDARNIKGHRESTDTTTFSSKVMASISASVGELVVCSFPSWTPCSRKATTVPKFSNDPPIYHMGNWQARQEAAGLLKLQKTMMLQSLCILRVFMFAITSRVNHKRMFFTNIFIYISGLRYA